MRQLAGDVRKDHIDPKGIITYSWHTVTDNDYRDCEKIIKVAALASGMINVRPVKGIEPVNAPF